MFIPWVQFGTGKWKRWLPRPMARCGFNAPAATATETAKRFRGSAGHVSDVQAAVAQICEQTQTDGIHRALHPPTPHEWIISDLMFDDSGFKVVPEKLKAAEFPVFAAHGGLTFLPAPAAHGVGSKADEVREQIVVPPRTMIDQCAKTIWSGIESSGVPIQIPVAAAKRRGLALVHDSVKANICCDYKALADFQDDGQYLLIGPCRQHQAALAIQPMTLYLEVLNPSFCVANVLHHGHKLIALKHGVRQTLLEKLECRDPFNATDEELDYARTLLERCYYTRDMPRSSSGEAHDAQHDPVAEVEVRYEEQRRRRAGGRLVQLLPTWLGDRLVHPCPAGCCGVVAMASKASAVDKIMDALEEVIFVLVGTPSLIKWTAICPILQSLLLMMTVGGDLIADGSLRMGNPGVLATQLDELEDGPGKDDGKRHVAQARVRHARAFKFLADTLSAVRLMIWLTLGMVAMVLHYGFYTAAKSTRRWDTTDKSAYPCLDMCSESRSPAVKAVKKLAPLSPSFC
jgi:hypothetical protein